MKLKWTASAYEKGEYVNAGDEFEADDDQAQTLISQGRAVAVGGGKPKSEGGEDEDSPVDNVTAAEAIEKIAHMRSKDKLQAIADSDQRVTVQDAAKKRLQELG